MGPSTGEAEAKRGRGRPRLPPAERAAADERRRQGKAENQRQRREATKRERERAANILASAIVARKGEVQKPKKGKAAAGFIPTDEDRMRVAVLAGLGLRQNEIATLVINPATSRPITEDTLREHFERELLTGPASANSKVSESLFKMATGAPGVKRIPSAAIFWAKARMGWRETTHIEVDLRAGVLVAPAGISPEAWIQAARAVDVEKLEPGASERASA